MDRCCLWVHRGCSGPSPRPASHAEVRLPVYTEILHHGRQVNSYNGTSFQSILPWAVSCPPSCNVAPHLDRDLGFYGSEGPQYKEPVPADQPPGQRPVPKPLIATGSPLPRSPWRPGKTLHGEPCSVVLWSYCEGQRPRDKLGKPLDCSAPSSWWDKAPKLPDVNSRGPSCSDGWKNKTAVELALFKRSFFGHIYPTLKYIPLDCEFVASPGNLMRLYFKI